MKNIRNSVLKKCMLGTGALVLAFALPLLKFYAFAPEQFLKMFTPLM